MKQEKKTVDRQEIFATMPVPKAPLTMAVPTIISQLVNLVYNMVDAFFIGRTGNSYMMAATTLTLTMVLVNISLSNLFGVGGGSLISRLMGAGKPEQARSVGAFSVYGALVASLLYSLLLGIFINPVLRFLGGSDQTMAYARSYAMIVVVAGSVPSMVSMTLAHLLRSTGFSGKAGFGLSLGGILNVFLDPLFMFVILPKGQEVTGAAIATLLSNVIAVSYLLIAYLLSTRKAPLSLSPKEAVKVSRNNLRALFSVGVPSALLTGLFDLANVVLNILAAAHSDLVLAGMGIVMKIERLPNAINVGLCQGMLPIIAYNFSSRDHDRMRSVIRTARLWGLSVSVLCIALFEILARQVSGLFLSTSAGDVDSAVKTVAYAALFLRIRALASPVQFLNYSSSFSMQAMGDGKGTILHACVRELVLYIPFMFLFDRLFGEVGLACALPIGEACGAVFAMFLLHRWLRKKSIDMHDLKG